VQLPLDDPRTQVLQQVQQALIGEFGRIVRPDDKRRSPEWTLVQGVIGAQTKTARSNAATDKLLADFGSWDKVAAAPHAQLVQILSRQSFPDQSARRLVACLDAIIAERGAVDLRHLSNQPTDLAMQWLEALPGVGRKISAGVMNASTFARRAMVIDGHHRRTMQRIGLVTAKADTARTYETLMQIAPAQWSAGDMDEHHLLLKRLGQTYCKPSRMDCVNCPAQAMCQTGAAAG